MDKHEWTNYFAALTGICADPNSTEVTRQAESLADEAVERFVMCDGAVYDPDNEKWK